MGGKARTVFQNLALAAFPLLALNAAAQAGDQAWLQYRPSTMPPNIPTRVVPLGESQLEKSAATELVRGLRGLYGKGEEDAKADRHSIVLGTYAEFHKRYVGWKAFGREPEMYPELLWDGDAAPERNRFSRTDDAFAIARDRGLGTEAIFIEAPTDRGVLYGTFTLLRMLASGEKPPAKGFSNYPALSIRWVDDWDNPDGSIERGYAGRSIFFEGGNVRTDLAPVGEYARLLASVGING